MIFIGTSFIIPSLPPSQQEYGGTKVSHELWLMIHIEMDYRLFSWYFCRSYVIFMKTVFFFKEIKLQKEMLKVNKETEINAHTLMNGWLTLYKTSIMWHGNIFSHTWKGVKYSLLTQKKLRILVFESGGRERAPSLGMRMRRAHIFVLFRFLNFKTENERLVLL